MTEYLNILFSGLNVSIFGGFSLWLDMLMSLSVNIAQNNIH